jgi:prepilin-type N-terminal cleavage/methylation domain-containing protein
MSSCVVDEKPMLKRSGESGYTMVELLVVMAITGIVGASILGVYQVSQDIYARASSLEAAQTGARAGLDRMTNEFRLIGSFWFGATDAGNAIVAATPTSITFMANVDDLSVIGGVEATPNGTATGNSVPLSLTATQTADAFRVYADTTLNDYIYIANGGRREVKRISAINTNTLTLASSLRWSPYAAGSFVRDVKRITYTRNVNATSTCPALTCLTRTQGGSGADPLVNNVTGLTFTYYDTTGGALGTNPNTALIREIQIDLTVQGTDGSQRRMTTRVKPRSLP